MTTAKRFMLSFALLFSLARCDDELDLGDFRIVNGEVVTAGDLTGASVAGITVRADGTGLSTVTDANGRFILSGVSPHVRLVFQRADGINAAVEVDDDLLTAPLTIQLQSTSATVVPRGLGKREIEGLITAISPTSITVNDASTGGPVTAAITSATLIRKGNTTLTAADLEVGDRVHVRALVESGGSLTALEIKLQNEEDDPADDDTQQIEGLITAVSASSITVNDASTHGPVTAAINAETVIRRGNTRLQASDLKVGDRVHVKAKAGTGNALTALEIILQNPA